MADPIPRGPFDQGLFLAHFNRGRELYEARHFEEAERQLEEAYLMRPRDARVLNLLGLVYFRGNKLIKAEEVYRKLVAENADAPTLHYNLGLICYKLNRLEDAEQAFRKALELTEGNPKIHFYLGSIYERLQRYKDAIYQYREAGANLMVQRVQGKLQTVGGSDSTLPPVQQAVAAPPPDPAPNASEHDTSPGLDEPPSAGSGEDVPFGGSEKVLAPVSPSLLADGRSKQVSTDRFLQDGSRSPTGTRPAVVAEPLAVAACAPLAAEAAAGAFRALERGLMEVEVPGKVFIKQGTIYSYSGNLTFWVKEKRPGGRAALVIVTGNGRLLLTDQERDLTFMQVADEAVFVEPAHLLACEEGLQPHYVPVSEGSALEVLALQGKGLVALSVASKPIPLTVKPGLPVCVPASSVVMWTGDLAAHVVEDPQVYEVVLPSSSSGGRLLRLEGSGRILVEQAKS